MRQITSREKISLAVMVLVAVAIFVYFVFLPMLESGQAGAESSLEAVEERLESMEKLADMEPLLVRLEQSMKEQSGYGGMTFKSGIADSMIIKYIAQTAASAEIRELEQLDAKPDTRRTADTGKSDQAVLGSVVDQLYLSQVMVEMEQETNNANGNADENSPGPGESNMEREDGADNGRIPPFLITLLEKSGISMEELRSNTQLQEKLRQHLREFLEERSASLEELGRNSELQEELSGQLQTTFRRDQNDESNDDIESSQSEESVEGTEPEAPNPGNETGDPDSESQTSNPGSKAPNLTFPPIPRDIPLEVKQSLIKLLQTSKGKTIGSADISRIIDEAGIEDDKEIERMRKRLQLYKDRLSEKKREIRPLISKIGIQNNVGTGQKLDRFSVRMVFKSRMDQLVRFVYNLQNSAKWLKFDGMKISVSDRRETLLSVELSMTATALYQ